MPKSRSYLNELKNRDEIQAIGKKLVDIELEIDKHKSERQVLDKYINETKKELIKLENKAKKHPKDPELIIKINRTREWLEDFYKRNEELENHIAEIESTSFKLRLRRVEAIKNGLVDIFHEVKSEFEKTQAELTEYNKLATNAQNKLKNKKNGKNYQEWVKYTELVMKTRYKLKRKIEELDSIKQVFKREFGED